MHNHSLCSHMELLYCEVCDIVYCPRCGREWCTPHWKYYINWSPYKTSTDGTGTYGANYFVSGHTHGNSGKD